MSISKSQAVLLSFLTDVFEKMGGVPEELITDNMKTVMDEARNEHFKGKVNTKFAQFAKDFGFKVKPCIAGRPRTKGKVETTMKILDEIHAYQGKLIWKNYMSISKNYVTVSIIRSIKERVKFLILEYQKEKNHLHQLPTERVRNSYQDST